MAKQTDAIYISVRGGIVACLFEGDPPAGRVGLYERFHGFPRFYVSLLSRGRSGRTEKRTMHELGPENYRHVQLVLQDCFFFLEGISSRDPSPEAPPSRCRKPPEFPLR